MTELHGIDVSHWQTGLDLRHTDAEFVICKATEGTSYVDPQCGVFADQARDLGIPFGVYHFYEGGGTAEADHFIRHVSGWVGRALLALDFETHTADVAGARAWLDRVHHQTGVRPVLYISASVLTAQNWAGVAAAGYGLWLARWADGPGPVAPWDELTLWQYTDHHKTGGMQVDADRFYGDRAAWSTSVGMASAATPSADSRAASA